MPASEPFLVEQSAAVAKNPAGVALQAQPRGGQRRFAMGEPIVLELAFTSAQPGAHRLSMATYDRSGRLWSESFRFDPAAKVTDPLADYFGEVRGGLGGIAAMPVTLSEKPTQVEVTLNEWARFEAPGTYRFFVRSTRVSDAGPETVTISNVVELEIVADAAWADTEMKRVQGVLATSKDSEARQKARTALRFLTTPAAAKAMVADLCTVQGQGDESRWPSIAGLFGSPDRAEVIRMLDEALTAPDCAVGQDQLTTLARLRSAGQRGPGNDGYAKALDEALVRLVDGLPKKSDAARATSLYTALTQVAERRDAKPNPRTDALKQGLARVLGKLPEPALAQLLGDQWPMVRSPSMAAPLLALAGEARPRGGALQSVSDLALERLVEIDPAGARTFILAEIGRPGGARLAFAAATLGLLKDAELPSLDGALIAGLKAPERDGISLEQRAELFARYASKGALANAWAAYKEIGYFRISLLSYLARHDPRPAQAEIAAIKDFDSLQRLSRFLFDARMEALIIARLDTTDGLQAASLLADRGTAAAEKALWARLQAPGATGTAKREVADAIRNAIVRGKGWMTPPDKIHALAATCPDPGCKQQIESSASRWGADGKRPALVLWSTARVGSLTGWVGHYDLRSVSDLQARIGQLPAGMTLEWQTGPADVDAALMDDVRKWAKARKVDVVAKH